VRAHVHAVRECVQLQQSGGSKGVVWNGGGERGKGPGWAKLTKIVITGRARVGQGGSCAGMHGCGHKQSGVCVVCACKCVYAWCVVCVCMQGVCACVIVRVCVCVHTHKSACN